jgi:hypothetical protein
VSIGFSMGFFYFSFDSLGGKSVRLIVCYFKILLEFGT